MDKPKKFNLKSHLTARLRDAFKKSPWPYLCRKKQKIGKQFKCLNCSAVVDDVIVDHISAVVEPKVGFVDWNTYINRLFCSLDNLQGLCNICNKEKIKTENAERKLYKTGRWSDESLKRSTQSKSENEINSERLRAWSAINALKPRTDKQRTASRRPHPELWKPVVVTHLLTGNVSEYTCLLAACNALNIIYTNAAKVCKGSRPSAGGYKFQYKGEL